GRGGLRWIDDCVGERLVEVGYIFERAAWGQGHATEVTGVFVTLAENHYGLEQLGAITLIGNDASTRVLEKNGFVFERWVHPELGPHKFLRRRLT
ncbi:MAG: GNAT family N-acetyltransferase, partial [Acidimicrobiales bacterium]